MTRRTETGPDFVRALPGNATTSILHADTLSYDGLGRMLSRRTQLDTIALSYYSGLGAVESSRSVNRFLLTSTAEYFNSDAFANLVTSSNEIDGTVTFQYQSRTGRLARHTKYGLPVDTAIYDGQGNQRRHSVTEYVGPSAFAFGVHTRSYYGTDNMLRVSDRRVAVEAVERGARPDQLGAFEEYRYDPLGRRILKRSRRPDCEGPCVSVIERYVWDGDDLLKETRYPGRAGISADSLEVDSGFVFSLIPTSNQIDPPPGIDTVWSPHYGTVTYTNGDVIDRPLLIERRWYAQDKNCCAVFDLLTIVPHYDARGIVDEGTIGGRAITSQGFKMDWPGADVGVFGDRRYRGAPRSWTGGMTDQMRDASGLQYKRNRYYDPGNGRFTQEDPIGLAGGMNLYGFAGGDPVNFSDPRASSPRAGRARPPSEGAPSDHTALRARRLARTC